MSIFGAGHEVVTSTTRPASPSVGQLIYQTDTDEYLKYVSYGGSNRWMQVIPKSNRNIIINGSGLVAQRSTGSVALTTSVVYGSIDRWAANQATSAAGTISRITTSLPTVATNNVVFPSGFRFGRNNAATNTGIISVAQAVETFNSTFAAGKQVTLSYWAKSGANYSSASSLFNAKVQSGTGTDQAVNAGGVWTGATFALTSTPTITTSWAFYSITGTVASTATQLEVIFSYTPVGTAGADDNVYITGVQLEIGSAPSEFEVEEFGDVLHKCQRYYFVQPDFSQGVWSNTGGAIRNQAHTFPFAREMRIVPTIANSFLNQDNAVNGGQTVSKTFLNQYVYASNTGFPYYTFRLGFGASAEL